MARELRGSLASVVLLNLPASAAEHADTVQALQQSVCHARNHNNHDDDDHDMLCYAMLCFALLCCALACSALLCYALL